MHRRTCHTHARSTTSPAGILLCTLAAAVLPLKALKAATSTPLPRDPGAKVSTLSVWSVTSVRAIGYVSLGITHGASGDHVTLYDVRTDKPTPLDPATQLSMRPPLRDDGVFIVSSLRRGNRNRLGGHFNGFAASGVSYRLGILPGGDGDGDGDGALTFSFDATPKRYVGFWVHLFATKAPPAARRFLDVSQARFLFFRIRGAQGGEQITLQVADRRLEKREDSLPIGDVASYLPAKRIATHWQDAWVPLSALPQQLDREQMAAIILLAHDAPAGRVAVRDLGFSVTHHSSIPAETEKSKPVAPKPHTNAMWLWETHRVASSPEQRRRLVDFCRREGISRLFVQVPYEASRRSDARAGAWTVTWDQPLMRQLIGELHAAGIVVEALDGDARFALRPWHGRVLELVRSVVAFNKGGNPEQRFVGVRFDIEPYLLDEFAGNGRAAVLTSYLELLEAVHRLTEPNQLTLGVDVPFWFDSLNEFYEPTAAIDGRPATEHILDIADNIGVMDYRTTAYGADGVIEHGRGELEYAAKAGKSVFIGLETVPLPDETIVEYTRQGTGAALVVAPLAGNDGAFQVIRLAPRAGSSVPADLPDDAVVLRESRSVVVPTSKVSFDSLGPDDLRRVVAQAHQELSTYPSFAGFVFHSYESYQPWLAR